MRVPLLTVMWIAALLALSVMAAWEKRDLRPTIFVYGEQQPMPWR